MCVCVICYLQVPEVAGGSRRRNWSGKVLGQAWDFSHGDHDFSHGRSGRFSPPCPLTKPLQSGQGWFTGARQCQTSSPAVFPALGCEFRHRNHISFRIPDQGLAREAGIPGDFRTPKLHAPQIGLGSLMGAEFFPSLKLEDNLGQSCVSPLPYMQVLCEGA